MGVLLCHHLINTVPSTPLWGFSCLRLLIIILLLLLCVLRIMILSFVVVLTVASPIGYLPIRSSKEVPPGMCNFGTANN